MSEALNSYMSGVARAIGQKNAAGAYPADQMLTGFQDKAFSTAGDALAKLYAPSAPVRLPPLTKTEIGTAARNRMLGGSISGTSSVRPPLSATIDQALGSTAGGNKLPTQVFIKALLSELRARATSPFVQRR